jgi:hypothetical protein
MTIGPQNRVGMAQENLSRYLEQFKSRWQPKLDAVSYASDPDDAKYLHRSDLRDFEIELTNLVQAAFTAAQAPFIAELDVYRQQAWSASSLRDFRPFNEASELAKRGVKISGDPLAK